MFVALCICVYVCESTYIYMSVCVNELCHVSLYVKLPLWVLGTSPATFLAEI